MADAGENPPVEEVGEKVVIGLSFGNSNSSIAFCGPDGKADVIANEDGDRQIPTVLSYKASEEYHGAQAKAHLIRNASNTIAYFRDYLGKKYEDIDPTNSHASAHPIEHEGTAAFKVHETSDEETSTLTIEEVTVRHLKRLRDSAADFIGKKVDGAVIAVPTDFTEEQRKALTEASKKADLPILQLVHEPVAALLSYDARTNQAGDKNVVVIDIGGTRTDAAVISVRSGMYTVIATSHDYSLGGNALDQVLVDHFAKEFIKKNKTDPRENARSLAKLKAEAEGTKRTLSLSTSATISIDSLADGFDFHSTVNRLRYDLLAKKVVDSIVSVVENVVKKANLDVLDIDEVVLAGGVSHTPKVASRIAAIFPENTLVHAPSLETDSLNPAEITARGAAIQASLIAEFDQEDIDQSSHPAVTVAPYLSKALGVAVTDSATGEDTFLPIFQAQTAAPARKSATIKASADGDVLVKIAEGVRHINVHKPEKPVKEKSEDAEDDEDDSDYSDEEPEEIRTKKWEVEKVIAETVVKGVKKGQEIEVGINIAVDLALSVTVRVVGGKDAIRGAVPKSS